ncbi:unnamed protein product [Mycena citricolor]|uniref:Plus3 domain-containing protein n=1 Tax=Mycena citricolor TaxID=2018698 RepID=A0AAD2HNK1_9AGAR|nr:unnamed protein product [Mycena citricolor]CAK5278461.1 unnamed protein product [Mycena citricolor]
MDFDDELLELVDGSSKRKRSRDGSAPGGKSKKGLKKRKVADSDDEPESEEEEDTEGDSELYPLEGKYVDEQDRAELLGKPEFEREQIISERMDEKERIRDRKYVEKMRANQLAGVAGVGDEDPKSRPARSSGKDRTKDRSLHALKAKRKAKDEKKKNHTGSPKNGRDRSSSPTDMDMSDTDSEDGQITRQQQQEERYLGKPKSSSSPVDDLPLSSDYLRKIGLTRDHFVQYMSAPWFEQMVVGCWVRYLIGMDSGSNRRVYRICRVMSLVPVKPYKITGDKMIDRQFVLKHGAAEKAWSMERTSNDPWTDEEFIRLKDTCVAESTALPTRKEVDERLKELRTLVNKRLTEEDVNTLIAKKRQAQPFLTGTSAVAERSRLIAQRTLAQRRNDPEEVRQIDEQLAKLVAEAGGGSGAATPVVEDEVADRLARVNERNRKANMEAVRLAELAEAERRRQKRKGPHAKLDSSRPQTPGLGTPGTDEALKADGKTFEAAIIDSIELDLGDF